LPITEVHLSALEKGISQPGALEQIKKIAVTKLERKYYE
jgi:hypothetical protein